MKERLQKFIARRGVCSRRAAEQLILDARVSVNDVIVTELGTRIDPSRDTVAIDREALPLARPTRTLMLHKPVGYLSTCKISREKGPTVLDLLPSDRRYFPVGRLDKGSSGLLLMTDDGDLAYQLTHPKFGSEKVYLASMRPSLTTAQMRLLESGVELDDGPARALRVQRVKSGVQITLGEGRNRQIHRMMSQIGARVTKLHRIQFAGLGLGQLPPGRWRELTRQELEGLRSIHHSDSRSSRG